MTIVRHIKLDFQVLGFSLPAALVAFTLPSAGDATTLWVLAVALQLLGVLA